MRFVFGDCDLDTERYELRRAGRAIALGPQGFKVLTHLLQRAGRAVAKHDLLEAFWSDISDAHYAAAALHGDRRTDLPGYASAAEGNSRDDPPERSDLCPDAHRGAG